MSPPRRAPRPPAQLVVAFETATVVGAAVVLCKAPGRTPVEDAPTARCDTSYQEGLANVRKGDPERLAGDQRRGRGSGPGGAADI